MASMKPTRPTAATESTKSSKPPESFETSEPRKPREPAESRPAPAPRADRNELEAILGAWHAATVKLEQTHALLAEEVRRLTGELEVKNRELARKNRLADLGQMASHVAHEVRNNLVPLTLYTSLLRRRVADDRQSVSILDRIDTGLTALGAMVNDLLHFTSDRAPMVRPFRLRELLDEVYAGLAPQLAAQAIRTVTDVPDDLVVHADPQMVRRAVLNLTLNALDAMPEGGTIVVTAAEGPRGVELEVADTGCGLSDEARRRAFEPFFSTKNGGTGLGLAIVSRIAQAHGGEVFAANCPDGGAAFTVRLPARRQWEVAA